MEVNDLGDIFGEMGGFSDFFKAFFGGGGQRYSSAGGRSGGSRSGGSRVYTQQPAAYQQKVTISFYEAFHGATRRLDINGAKKEIKIPAGVKTGTKVRAAGAVSAGRGCTKRLIFDHSGRAPISVISARVMTCILRKPLTCTLRSLAVRRKLKHLQEKCC